MVFSNGIITPANARQTWQCGYSGCQEVRATKLNGQLHRFCEQHRRRQNQHQRDSVERQRRGERRRASRRRVRLLPTEDVWALMELDTVMETTHDHAATQEMVDEWHSLLLENAEMMGSLMPLQELILFPIVSGFLDLLPALDA